MIQTGVQPYSSWYVAQRYSEDKHGPHNDILPQPWHVQPEATLVKTILVSIRVRIDASSARSGARLSAPPLAKKQSPNDQADFEVNRVSTRSRERVLPVSRRVHGGVALGPDAVKGKVPDGAIEMHKV